MNIVIRRATEGDAVVLSRMALKIFLDTFAAQNKAEDIEMHAALSYSPEIQCAEVRDLSKVWLIAEVDGEPAGFAMVGEPGSESCRAFESPVELFRFYIDKEWHGRGVARPMMDAVDDIARTLGGRTLCLGVWEHNLRAIRFYQKSGFNDAGSQPYLLGTDLQTDRVMVRSLG